MAFGSKVTDFPQQAVGLFGYTLKIDVTSLLFHSVSEVQIQKGVANTPEPIYTEEKLATIQSYLNNINCPKAAFNYSDGNVTIFLKEDGTAVPVWAAGTMYEAGDYIQGAITGQDAVFQCTVRGLSGLVEPTWSEGTVVDLDTIWSFVKYLPFNDGFPYETLTRFAVIGLRKAQDVSGDSDYIDVPDKDIELVKMYVLASIWLTKKKVVPLYIQQKIDKLEFAIKNES